MNVMPLALCCMRHIALWRFDYRCRAFIAQNPSPGPYLVRKVTASTTKMLMEMAMR